MKILYVIDKLPCPAFAGVHLRILNIGRQLSRKHEVKTVLVCEKNYFEEKRYKASCTELGEIETFLIPSQKQGSFTAKISHKFWQHWPWKLTKSVSQTQQNRFEEIAAAYDMVWYETLLPAARFRYHGYEKAFADLDDLNHIKFRMLNKQEKNIKQRIANKCMEIKWQKAETKAIKQFSMAGLCSEQDKQYLSDITPNKIDNVHVIPNGFENVPAQIRTEKTNGPTQLGFIGVLKYKPNLEGLRWFVDNVWPMVLEKHPDTILRIVGKLSDKTQLPQGENIQYTGFIEDVKDEFNSWTAMVVPLLSGGGTRLKILESFARGCPVISTTIGAYGLNITNDNIIICDQPTFFAKQILDLANNPQLQEQMSRAGRKTFEDNYTWDIIGDIINENLQR